MTLKSASSMPKASPTYDTHANLRTYIYENQSCEMHSSLFGSFGGAARPCPGEQTWRRRTACQLEHPRPAIPAHSFRSAGDVSDQSTWRAEGGTRSGKALSDGVRQQRGLDRHDGSAGAGFSLLLHGYRWSDRLRSCQRN